MQLRLYQARPFGPAAPGCLCCHVLKFCPGAKVGGSGWWGNMGLAGRILSKFNDLKKKLNLSSEEATNK